MLHLFFTEHLTWVLVLQILWEHLQSIYSVLKFFQVFIHLYSRGDKKNKNSKPLNKIKSTESYTRDMVLKFLPEPSHKLNIFHKNYQALYHQDRLVMQLTYHELAWIFQSLFDQYCMWTFYYSEHVLWLRTCPKIMIWYGLVYS